MRLSKVAIYLVILVALGAWLYFVEIKQKETKHTAEEQASKLVIIDKDQVVRFDLKSEDGAVIELKKPADTWVLTLPVNTRADQSAINSLLQAVASARSEKVVMEKDANWAEYGLDKPSFSIGLETKDASTDIFFGESNPSKTSYYVRVSNDPRLFLVADTLKNSLSKTALDLRDKSVIAMAPSDVDRIVISYKGGATELQRDGPEKWMMVKPEEMKVKGGLVTRELNSLTNLSAREIIDEPSKEGDPYGLAKPEKQILLAGPKLEQTLMIGGPVPKEGSSVTEGDVYARVKDHGPVYVIDGRTLKGLVQPDHNLLRDKTVLSFNPADIERLEIELDSKKWVALRNSDKKWSLEEPQKIANVDSWTVTSILWDLKDLEWKTIKKEAPSDLSELHLANPQLVASIWKQGEKDPIVLKVGWSDVKPFEKDNQGVVLDRKDPENDKGNRKGAESSSASKTDQIEKPSEASPAKPSVPDLVYAIAEPNEAKAAAFEMSGNFIGRLRTELERIPANK